MHPQKIVDALDQKQQKTLIIDNIQGGTSFASFIHFMYAWAKDCGIEKASFSKALRCAAVSDDALPENISIPEANLTVSIVSYSISNQLRIALNGNASHDTDRFVPHYDPSEWDKLPVNVEGKNNEKIQAVKNLIENAIQGKPVQRPKFNTHVCDQRAPKF
jgi:hypothetical protein